MKMIITDTGIYPGSLKNGDVLIQENGSIHSCNGCLDCWWKTPGVCTHKDTLSRISSLLQQCDELIIVSCCLYGSFSCFVQKVLERMMPYFMPEYETEEGRMVHKCRGNREIRISAYFYGGQLDEAERMSAQSIVRRLALRMGGRVKRIMFVADAMQIGGLS